MDDKPPMEPHLRAQAGKARRELRDHPAPERLAAYRAGELSAEEAEGVRDHLALCPECAQLLLDLVAFEEHEPAEEPAGLASGDVEAAWQRLRPKLEREGPSPPVAAPERFRPAEKPDPAYAAVDWRRRLRNAYALAAALFLGVVGLAVWGVSQKRQLEQMAAPQLGRIAHHSLDEDQIRSGGEEEADLRFSQRDKVAISLDAPPAAYYHQYEAEILDAAGKSRFKDRTSEDRVDLHFFGSFFEPGTYTIRLYGIQGGGRVPLGEIRFEIVPPGGRRP